MSKRDLIIVVTIIAILGMGFISWENYIGQESRAGTEKLLAAISKSGSVQKPDETMAYLMEMFRSETDTMIYKATVWVGFWMAILAIVMILPTLHQMSEQRRARDELDKCLKSLNEKETELRKKVKSSLTELDCAIEETRISHIMGCITNIPDPVLVRQKEGKPLSKTYLRMLYKESVRFENLVGRMYDDYKAGRNNRIEEEMPYIHLIIVEILTSLTKSQIIFNDVDLNVDFYEVLRVAGLQYDYICANSLDIESVKGSINVINQKFRKLINRMGD